ncbi:hypothetical protein [Herbaspirillum sp. NPDC101396]|uniref:hypothetical protein n=1 Tax=Herbaspirillum sp. NPDC101396 TaxID=3364005 RepID=UPI00383A05F6
MNVPLEIYTCVYLKFRMGSGGEAGLKTSERLRKGFCRQSKNINTGEHENLTGTSSEFSGCRSMPQKTRREKIRGDKKQKCKREKTSSAHRVSFNPVKFT